MSTVIVTNPILCADVPDPSVTRGERFLYGQYKHALNVRMPDHEVGELDALGKRMSSKINCSNSKTMASKT